MRRKLLENSVNNYYPEAIQTAERMQEYLGNDENLEKIGEAFYEAYISDDEKASRTFRRIFSQYINGSHEVRFIMNDMLISLCGWSFDYLLDVSDASISGNESDSDNGSTIIP